LELLEMVPAGPIRRAPGTNRRIHGQLREPEIDDLAAGYLAGSTVYELAHQFSIPAHRVEDP
jgi:hypothetical protein